MWPWSRYRRPGQRPGCHSVPHRHKVGNGKFSHLSRRSSWSREHLLDSERDRSRLHAFVTSCSHSCVETSTLPWPLSLSPVAAEALTVLASYCPKASLSSPAFSAHYHSRPLPSSNTNEHSLMWTLTQLQLISSTLLHNFCKELSSLFSHRLPGCLLALIIHL